MLCLIDGARLWFGRAHPHWDARSGGVDKISAGGGVKKSLGSSSTASQDCHHGHAHWRRRRSTFRHTALLATSKVTLPTSVTWIGRYNYLISVLNHRTKPHTSPSTNTTTDCSLFLCPSVCPSVCLSVCLPFFLFHLPTILCSLQSILILRNKNYQLQTFTQCVERSTTFPAIWPTLLRLQIIRHFSQWQLMLQCCSSKLFIALL